MKCLFICRKGGYYEEDAYYAPAGLMNSATYVSDMLNRNGVQSKVVQVKDNNGIDKEVYDYKPTHVFIEALWVVPDKFAVLIPLHKNVKWIIRIHSELPFLAQESIAMEWLFGYQKYYPNVIVSSINKAMTETLNALLPTTVLFLPNYYLVDTDYNTQHPIVNNTINIGCFGAIRPLKNQLLQAVAAIMFAQQAGLKLYFHINKDRVIIGGVPVLANIEALFKNVARASLVEWEWLTGDSYTQVLRAMNLGMQVSLSETFGLTSADMVNSNLLLVTSPEVYWASAVSKANPTDVNSVVEAIKRAFDWNGTLTMSNKDLLGYEVNKNEMIWKKFISQGGN